MRLPGLVPLLSLACTLLACSVKNPRFDLDTEATGDNTSAATTDPNPGTSEPTGTSTSTTASTQGMTATSEPGTTTDLTTATTSTTSTTGLTTDEPDTDSTTSGAGTPDLPAACEYFSTGDQTRHVHQVAMGEAPVSECDASTTYIGSLEMTVAGDLLLLEDPECDGVGKPTHIIGKKWPTKNPHEYTCVKATVHWKKIAGECQIGALLIYPVVDNMGDAPLYMAALSFSGDNPKLPLWPGHGPLFTCQCGCCEPEDIGDYTFDVFGTAVMPDAEAMFEKNGGMFRFKSIQSYIGPGCQNDPTADKHFDWFAERIN